MTWLAPFALGVFAGAVLTLVVLSALTAASWADTIGEG